jgi:CRP/FNR family transcriptional regulator, cyclic AMP receptor protein
MLPIEMLIQKGATIRKYPKGKPIFFEDEDPRFFYQVVEGSVRMVNITEYGKEFIQGIFTAGESFGEPVLITERPYPATAISNEDSSIIRIRKQEFVSILKENADIHFEFTRTLAQRLYDKSLIAKEISSYAPEHRILTLLKMLKKKFGHRDEPYKVDLSRQQLADMLGLRVETVIRAIKRLEEKSIIIVKKGKIYQ